MQAIRNTLYVLLQLVLTPVWAIMICATFWMPPRQRNLLCATYTRLFVWFAKHLCRIDYVITGWENLPPKPFIVLSKHSSTWETLALESWFAPGSFVAKRELLWLPFFGWGFALSSPINIDRKAGSQAMEKLIEQGRERLQERGFTIVVFPEGTRIAAGTKGKYKTGGARLAIGCNVPIVPIAHNAGYCWPRHPWKKHPGRVTLSILPPINPTGRQVGELNEEIERVIETEVARIGDPRHVVGSRAA
jgi:1-acyl-sn-glycerol-3-phosphate acyltransferase